MTASCTSMLTAGLGIFVLLLILAASFAAGAPESVILRGSVVDEDGKPVAGFEVRIQSPIGRDADHPHGHARVLSNFRTLTRASID